MTIIVMKTSMISSPFFLPFTFIRIVVLSGASEAKYREILHSPRIRLEICPVTFETKYQEILKCYNSEGKTEVVPRTKDAEAGYKL
jgi:hypothetical protein